MLLCVTLLLSGCAAPSKVRYPMGEALLSGETPAPLPAPDSLTAELELTGYERRGKTSVSAAFSALPLQKYKFDLFGFPGMVAAGFLWTDTGWSLVLYERDGYLQGYGDTVEMPDLGVKAAPVHDLFSWLWGDFFPGTDPEAFASPSTSPPTLPPKGWEPAGANAIRYQAGGHGWRVTLDPATGLVQEAVRADSAFRIRYQDYRVKDGRPLPGRVRVFSGDRPVLDISVDRVDDHPKWRRNPFQLRIPKGFKRLRSTPGG
jgi:hypothetical protein